jgi:hypothetical protein
MKLYRYMRAEHAIKTIEEKLLKVCQVSELNDAFDLRPGIKTTNVQITDPELVEFALEGWTKDFQVSLGKIWGLVCFSSEIEETVLWAHYADSHKGVALEIEVTPKNGNPIEVDYTPAKRPCYELNELQGVVNRGAQPSEEFKTLGNKLVRSKAPEWGYEKEYRYVIPLTNCECRQGMYFIPFVPKSLGLTKVILGYKCPLSESYVFHTLAANGFKNVGVARTRCELSEYKIKSKEVYPPSQNQ